MFRALETITSTRRVMCSYAQGFQLAVRCPQVMYSKTIEPWTSRQRFGGWAFNVYEECSCSVPDHKADTKTVSLHMLMFLLVKIKLFFLFCLLPVLPSCSYIDICIFTELMYSTGSHHTPMNLPVRRRTSTGQIAGRAASRAKSTRTMRRSIRLLGLAASSGARPHPRLPSRRPHLPHLPVQAPRLTRCREWRSPRAQQARERRDFSSSWMP